MKSARLQVILLLVSALYFSCSGQRLTQANVDQVTEGLDAPPGEIYFGAENPKGELGFYINSKGGGVPHRLKIRAPSFVNLSILPELLPGCMMGDVVAVLGSLDFVMGECDR